MNINEIRLNGDYSTYSIADYHASTEDDSKPIINHRTMRTTELFQKIQKNIAVPAEYKFDHLFPPNCRYYEKYEDGFFVIIEEPPAFRTIAVDKDMSNEIESLKSMGKLKEYGYENWAEENTKPYMFNLALPYVVFMFAFNKSYDPLGGYVFFRTSQISGFADTLYKAPFLNISDSQQVCFGDRFYKGPKRSIYADTSYAISSFWSTRFNPDYIYNYVAYQDVAGVCDYLTWEYYSNEDPMFIYNVDWIECKRFNIGGAVEDIRNWIFSNGRGRNGESQQFGYNSLEMLFSQQNEKELEDVPKIGIKEPLIYDISQYIQLGKITCNVGDSFKLNDGRTVFVDSFLGFRQMPIPVFINLEREDGRVYRMKLTKATRKYIEEKISEERNQSEITVKNGSILRQDDILVMKNRYGNDVYRKIHYIRKTVNGITEGRFGSEFYIVENLPDNISVMDLSNPEYMGMKLEKDKKYIVLRGTHYPTGPFLQVAMCEYQEITTGTRSNLIIKLEESEGSNKGYRYDINLTNHNDRRIFAYENIRELPTVFRLGRQMMWVRDGNHDTSKAFALPNLGVATTYGMDLRNASYEQYTRRDSLIKDDTFFLASWDMDIEFKIGEKVVVANWEDPLDMLTVKQIEGFVEDHGRETITFVLKDKNDKIYKHDYIQGNNVKVGSVRKITNKCEDLSSGMKIIANETGISMFPKKDANIIVGFLYDTGGEPLVLCSNACTLWYSDVTSKFDIIPMSDSKWKNIPHAQINPSKMRIQAGDFINGKRNYSTDCGYLAYRPRSSRTIRAQQIRYMSHYEESYVFDISFSRDVRFDSFPNPRLTTSQENALGFINAFPNFHGMYTETGRYFSPYLFAKDSRSILNVPDNSE